MKGTAIRKDEEPLLFVDVNFNDMSTRIAMYEDSNPVEVAKLFAKKYNMDEEVLESLADLL